jgi:type IV pilus assembly protein PilB
LCSVAFQDYSDPFLDVEFSDNHSRSERASADDQDHPIIRLVNLLIQEALSLKATGIRVDHLIDRLFVYYEIDAIWVERDHPPEWLMHYIVTRFRVLASINFGDNFPQVGRFQLNFRGEYYELIVIIRLTGPGQSLEVRIYPASAHQ